jgi:hypothetical protein
VIERLRVNPGHGEERDRDDDENEILHDASDAGFSMGRAN